MCKRAMIGLFTMSVVALVWTDANAGCCCTPRICASWITGNAICYLKTNGPDPSGKVICDAFGTVPPREPPDLDCANTLDEGCGMKVVVTCGRAESRLDPKVGGDDVRTEQRTIPNTFEANPLGGFTHCQTTSGGRLTGPCKTFYSLEPPIENLANFCKTQTEHPIPETATPTEFNAKSCVGDQCITYRCSLPSFVVEKAIRLGQSLAYVCVPKEF